MKVKSKYSVNRQLMEMGERAFWDEFERLINAANNDERYVVWDGKKRKVIVFGAKFSREKIKGQA